MQDYSWILGVEDVRKVITKDIPGWGKAESRINMMYLSNREEGSMTASKSVRLSGNIKCPSTDE